MQTARERCRGLGGKVSLSCRDRQHTVCLREVCCWVLSHSRAAEQPLSTVAVGGRISASQRAACS